MWDAVTIVRTLALSRATVGKAMPWANTPSSNNRSENLIAQRAVPHDDRGDGALARAGVETERLQPRLEEPGVLPQPLHPLRLGLEHVERSQAGRRDRWRMRRREQEGPGSSIQELDERPRAGDIAPERAECFRERPDLDVDPAVKTEMIDRAAPLRTEHAARMRVVDHHDAAELVGEIAEPRKRAEVSVHAENAIGDQQRPLPARKIREDGARSRDVAMRKHLDGGATETSAVDDARVIQFVGHDDVIAPEQSRDSARVRRETTLKDHARLGPLERGQAAFELHVDLHRAGNRCARSRCPRRAIENASSARSRSRGCVVNPR